MSSQYFIIRVHSPPNHPALVSLRTIVTELSTLEVLYPLVLSALLPSKSTALYTLQLTAHEPTVEGSLSTYPLIREPIYFTYLRTDSLETATYRLVPGIVSCVKMMAQLSRQRTYSSTLLDTNCQARGMSSERSDSCQEHHLL